MTAAADPRKLADTVRERVELCREQIAESPYSHTTAAGWYAEDVPALVALAEQLQQERDEAVREAELSKWPKEAAQEYHRLKVDYPAEVQARESAEAALREEQEKPDDTSVAHWRNEIRRCQHERDSAESSLRAAQDEVERLTWEREEAFAERDKAIAAKPHIIDNPQALGHDYAECEPDCAACYFASQMSAAQTRADELRHDTRRMLQALDAYWEHCEGLSDRKLKTVRSFSDGGDWWNRYEKYRARVDAVLAASPQAGEPFVPITLRESDRVNATYGEQAGEHQTQETA